QFRAQRGAVWVQHGVGQAIVLIFVDSAERYVFFVFFADIDCDATAATVRLDIVRLAVARAASRRATSGANAVSFGAATQVVAVEARRVHRTTQTLALRDAQEPCEGEYDNDANNKRWNNRNKDLSRVEAQSCGRANCRTAPRQDIHGAVDKTRDHGKNHGAHAQAQVKRQHRRRGDDEGGGAIAIE